MTQQQIRIIASFWLIDEEGTALPPLRTFQIGLEDLPLALEERLATSGLAPGRYDVQIRANETLTNTRVLDVTFPSVFEILPEPPPPEPPPEDIPEFKFFLGQQVCASQNRVGNITRLPTSPGGRYIVRWTSPPEAAGDTRSMDERALDDCGLGLPEPPVEAPDEPAVPNQRFNIGDLVLIGGATATTWIITDARLRNNSWEYFVDVERGVGGNPGWVRENALSLAAPEPEEPPAVEEPPPESPPPPAEAPPAAFSIGDRVFVGGSRATIWMVTASEFRDGRWRHFVTVVSGSGNEGWVGESLLSRA